MIAQEAETTELLTGLPEHQKWVAIATAAVILVGVIELVRRRKLREEYSFLWLGTGAVLMVLALWPTLLNLFCAAIGAKTPNAALFFGALIFLMAVSLLMSMRLSRLTMRNKALSQQAALQKRELEELREAVARLSGKPDGERPVTPARRKGIAKDGAA